MITGNMRIPREDPQESAKEINFMVEKRRAEIEKILEKGDLSEAARLKLKVEAQFLHPNVRSVYQKVLNKIVDGFQQDRKSLSVF